MNTEFEAYRLTLAALVLIFVAGLLAIVLVPGAKESVGAWTLPILTGLLGLLRTPRFTGQAENSPTETQEEKSDV